jgi:hypothetical protein
MLRSDDDVTPATNGAFQLSYGVPEWIESQLLFDDLHYLKKRDNKN